MPIPYESGGRMHHLGADAVASKALARVFEAWSLTGERSAELADVSPHTWARMRSGTWRGKLGQDQLFRASALVALYEGLHLYFGEGLADRWVTLGNRGPLFQGRSPAEYMQEGGLPAILETRNYVDALRGGL